MNNQEKVNALLGVVSTQSIERIQTHSFMKSVDSTNKTHEDYGFSVFNPDQVEQAVELGSLLHFAANDAAENGKTSQEAVEIALDIIATEGEKYSAGLVRHAIKLFLTHNTHGQSIQVPSLMRRVTTVGVGNKSGTPTPIGGKTTSADENQLNWFREDPLMNEHHEHWHVVFPYAGFPSGSPLVEEKRHGEMFFYMHQQMLARYDAERLVAGLKRVEPYSDYRRPIEVGYDPGAFAIRQRRGGSSGEFEPFPARPANVFLEDIPHDKPGIGGRSHTIDRHETLRDYFRVAVAKNELIAKDGKLIELSGHKGSDLLGATNEVSRAGVNNEYYGNHHGFGHLLISSVGNPGIQDGIMAATEGNLRDPIFWRWHKHIDTFNFDYQSTQSSHDFSDAPRLRLSPDGALGSDAIQLIQTKKLPKNIVSNELAATATMEESKLGKLPVVDILNTETRNGVFKLSEGEEIYSYSYLWHEAFNYIFQMQNESSQDVSATLRVFLCPMEKSEELSAEDEWLNDRSLWIEMDKIAINAPAGQRSLICRPDTESSVIKRPAIISPAYVEDVDIPEGGDGSPSDYYCGCGWPYHLLLPKGDDKGRAFALLVIATDGKLDSVPTKPGECGSMSYCGAKDRYPDERPMGYPFDRSLQMSLVDLVKEQPNFALRKLTIKHSDRTGKKLT